MKCEKCGKEDSTVKEYTWMFAKELSRVLTGTETSGTKRTDTYRVSHSEFQPVSVSLCSRCIKKERIMTGLIPGVILLALTLISAAIFISTIAAQKPGEGLGAKGYFGIVALLFGYFAVDSLSTNSTSIALHKVTIKANKMGMTLLKEKV